MGAVRGEEASPLLLDCSRLEVVDAVSEMVSLLDAGRFLCNLSSTCASMASRLMSSQPFWIFTLARARRSWRARVIYGGGALIMVHGCRRPIAGLPVRLTLET